MNKRVLILTSLILSLSLIGMVSASYIQDISNNNLSNLTVTVGQNSSEAQLNLGDFSGRPWNTVSIPFSCVNGNLTVSGAPNFITEMMASSTSQVCSTLSILGESSGIVSFKISDLLNSVEISSQIQNGQTSPTINSFNLNGSMQIYITFPNNINSSAVPTSFPSSFEVLSPVQVNFTLYSLNQAGISLNSILSLSMNKTADQITSQDLSKIISQYASSYGQKMVGDANFTKDGREYTVKWNRGFGSNPSQYTNEVQWVVNQSLKMFNVEDLINEYVLPLASNYSELNNYTDWLNSSISDFNFNVSANFTGFQAKNGAYQIPLTLNTGSESVTKNVYITIGGIPSEDTTFTPSDPTESEWVQKVEGIPLGEKLSVKVFSSSGLDSNQQSKISSLWKTFQVLNFTLSGAGTSGTIYFKIPTSQVSNANNVRLYVWENNGWTGLSTTPLTTSGGYYTFSAVTPHFSTFMIAETLPSSPTQVQQPYQYGIRQIPSVVPPTNGGTTGTPTISGTGNQNPTTNLNGNGGGITGAVINAIGSPAGLSILGVIVVGLGVLVFVLSSRKRKLAEEIKK